MRTQTAIASKIRERRADNLMAVKGNQGSLGGTYKQVEKANGRVTTRRITVIQKLDWMIPSIRKRWKDLTTLIMLESESYSVEDQKTTKQKRFYISSQSGSAKEFSGLICQHWSVGKGCYWALDTLYRENHSQGRIEKAVKNCAILR